MQTINILDPALAQTHPQLFHWRQTLQSAGYHDQQIQSYFHQQCAAQQQQQPNDFDDGVHAESGEEKKEKVAMTVLTEQVQAMSVAAAEAANPQQAMGSVGVGMRQQHQKLQMARNIINAYNGQVTLNQVMAMDFARVQQLHDEIVQRLNQQQQQQQQQQQNTQPQPQQPPPQQAEYTTKGGGAGVNGATASAAAYQQSNGATHGAQFGGGGAGGASHHISSSSSAASSQAMSVAAEAAAKQSVANPLQASNGASSNGSGDSGGGEPQFDGENPIDIVLVLLHQYPQIDRWLQSMEYHDTVTSSRTHAVQFLTSLMGSQPQFRHLIGLIQNQLKGRRADGNGGGGGVAGGPSDIMRQFLGLAPAAVG